MVSFNLPRWRKGLVEVGGRASRSSLLICGSLPLEIELGAGLDNEETGYAGGDAGRGIDDAELE